MLLFSLFVFLLWFLLCCFDVFALFLLCLLCLALAFILEKFLPGALCFFLVLLFFCTLFICKNHVLLCVCSLTCLWVFPVLVPVCPFPFSPFASFACFCWALKALIFVPCVLPSTSRPSTSPVLLCRFCVFYMYGVAECYSTTPTCAPPIRILVTHHALRSPHPLYRP